MSYRDQKKYLEALKKYERNFTGKEEDEYKINATILRLECR